MTRARCVRTDAVHAAAAVLLLTALFAAGCVALAPEPVVPSPPPASAPDTASATARVSTLRVGLPAQGRANLLFACDAPATAPAGMLPETLLVSASEVVVLARRAFEEATDEEIALERGELDVAVFWPGELSARMRSDTRFREPSLGLRSRGVLVCVAGAGDTLAPPAADMEALNREAFAGDLQPWSALAGPGPGEGPPARYTVDRTVPGAKHLERILTREARPGGARTLKLVYLDQLVMGGEAAGEAAREAWRAPGVTSLFAIRCPVLAQPEARAAVDAIGAHAFAEMAPCAEGTGK
jgi:hypothetical protein